VHQHHFVSKKQREQENRTVKRKLSLVSAMWTKVVTTH